MYEDVFLLFNDGYRTLGQQQKYSLGPGVAIIYRDSIQLCHCFKYANTDRLLIVRVKLSTLYSFILVAFHADPHFLNEALAHLEHVLGMLRSRYQDADSVAP